MGSSEDKEEGGGGCLGTRLYFVLLGFASASSSLRKDWNSLSAISSRVKGAEDKAGDGEENEGCEAGFDALLSVDAADEEVEDHGQPIVISRLCW